ncbi:acetate--CoA ligase family protein [Orrella sp. JC864]|uniref:acetate--CoA ligase family protein n=1 Tax=Orrella sp. JC864 TaxID=3120298 RepID=UPI00300A5A83
MNNNLKALLAPESVAIVGASTRRDAIGTKILANLRAQGYEGRIYPVNPKYQELDGLACYPDLDALPEKVDAAFLAVPAGSGVALAEQAGRCGIAAVFVNANGYADGNAEGLLRQDALTEVARRYGLAVCGPNNIGMINVHRKTPLWTPRIARELVPGNVAVITQSGSIAIAISENERGIGFSYIITAGNEAVLDVSDYLDHVADDARTQVVLLYLETLRDPQGFQRAAAKARAAGKALVALKVGTSEAGGRLVQAHTGSLAGDDKLYDEFFHDLGVIRVRDLDEMLEAAVLLSSQPAFAPGPGLVALTLSGGEAALIADMAEPLGLRFPMLEERTIAGMRAAYPEYSTIRNPVDAWGLGFNKDNFRVIVKALAADPALRHILVCVDAPAGGGVDLAYALDMADVAGEFRQDKTFVFINNMAGRGTHAALHAELRRRDIPYLSGLKPALSAIASIARTAARRQPAVPPGPPPPMPPVPDAERAWFEALSQAGVPMVRSLSCQSAEQAGAHARQLGLPCVMKLVSETLPHKSDLGLVLLDLRDEAAVRQAYAALDDKRRELGLAPRDGEIVLQQMAAPGVELFLGIRNEPGFGSFIIVGVGGVLVEISRQSSMRRGPVDAQQAREMLQETVAAKLIAGVRGKGPYDMQAAVQAIVAFSRFGAQFAQAFGAMEINPLIVSAQGAMGVDFLAERRH